MAEHVVYLEKLHPVAQELVQEALPPGFTWSFLREGSTDEAVEQLDGIRAAIAATFPVTDSFMARVPSLKFVQCQGVGLDNFEVEAMHRRGVLLAINTAGFESVGEHNIMLILAAYRRLPFADRSLRSGDWAGRWALRRISHDLVGKTVGLAGFGRNARATAKRLQGFGCRVLFTEVVDPKPPLYHARRVTEEELLRQSDVLCLHLPLTTATEHWLNASTMDMMKPGAVVINTSRGPLIDMDELHRRLVDGRIGAAGLDVYTAEPPPRDTPLWKLDNVVVTPHIAAGSVESFQEKMSFAFANIRRFLGGRTPLNLV